MNTYDRFKRKLGQRVDILRETIEEIEAAGGLEDRLGSRWKEQLTQVEASLNDPLLRIAVVGTVKSGKSTLINAMAEADLLRRGAGVITAFITRVITGRERGGWVELKTWPQVLDELHVTLQLLPETQEVIDGVQSLDIRKPADREALSAVIDAARARRLQQGRPADAHLMLLKGYVSGFEQIQSYVGDTVNRLLLDPHSLRQHQRFVGDECQAVYLRDMELHYPIEWLGDQVELADCQGIDSPNPLHFAMLQDYLQKAHFVLYVISSRSGLREADYRLLDFIRAMEMFPQTFFVINADLDDHPHQEDLDRLAGRVADELSWVVPNPRFFVFSALYQLIRALDGAAGERERRHFELWREDVPLAERIENGFAEFREALGREICDRRFGILSGSGLSRLGMVAASVANTAAAQRKLMDHSLHEVRRAAADLKEKEKRLNGSLETLRNAITGLQMTLKEEVEGPLQDFFDVGRGHLLRETAAVIENFPLAPEFTQDGPDLRWIFQQLHHLYLDFRQALSRHLVDRVNLQLLEFARHMEGTLRQRMEEAFEAFWVLFGRALEDYREGVERFGVGESSVFETTRVPGRHTRRSAVPPSFSAFVDQQAMGRGILLMKFGLARMARFFGEVRNHLKKHQRAPSRAERADGMIANALKLLKTEAVTELFHSLVGYKHEFKHRFLYELIDGETTELLKDFQARAEMARLDLGSFEERSRVEGEARMAMIERLTRVNRISRAMIDELEAMRSDLERPRPDDEAAASPAG